MSNSSEMKAFQMTTDLTSLPTNSSCTSACGYTSICRPYPMWVSASGGAPSPQLVGKLSSEFSPPGIFCLFVPFFYFLMLSINEAL